MRTSLYVGTVQTLGKRFGEEQLDRLDVSQDATAATEPDVLAATSGSSLLPA